MEEIFEPYDACWRGLGTIPRSGLRFKSAFAGFDAAGRFGLDLETTGRDLAGCRCGDVLRGVIRPEGCRLFGKKCRPDSPLGPCMVSYEGACLIHFKYGPEKGVRA
jgi:hydrogenase expression/formation protein HypD